jgi:Uma2 family endonuclease
MTVSARGGQFLTQQPRPNDLTADAFLEWSAHQPQGRFELSGGEIVAIAPEHLGHTRVKSEALIAFRAAIAAKGLACEAIADGIMVRVDDRTVYEPDALVRCGPRAPNDVIELDDPVIVIEVVSPSSRGVDTGVKLAAYFQLPALRDYLILQPEARAVVHHRRGDDGNISTRILHDGELALDPPGLSVAVAEFFATL